MRVRKSARKEGPGSFRFHPENINRKGRPPKGEALAERIREFLDLTGIEVNKLDKAAGENLVKMIRKDVFVRALFQNAIVGNGAAMRIIREAVDGPISLDLNVTYKVIPAEGDSVDADS